MYDRQAVNFRGIAGILRGATARTGYWALADQAVVSASNFFTTFYLARNLDRNAFGIFSLGYAVILLAGSVQQGIIISPMVVLAAPLEGGQRTRYFSSSAVLQLLLAVSVSSLLFIAGTLFGKVMTGELLVVVALNTFFYMGQEYFRRGLFTIFESRQALFNDVICYGGQVFGIVLLYETSRLSWSNALYIVGGTSGIALVVGLFQLREVLNIRLLAVRKVFLQNWHYGKWLLGSQIATFTSSQAYLFISAYFLGPAAAGILRAVQNVFGPTHVLLNGFGNFVPQVASKKLSSGGRELLAAFIKKIGAVLLGLMLFYCVLVSIKAEAILRLLYKDQYAKSGGLVILFGISYVFTALTFAAGFGLRAIQKTSVIFRAYVGASIITVLISVPLIYLWGVAGAVAGIIAAGAFVSLYSFFGVRQFLVVERR